MPDQPSDPFAELPPAAAAEVAAVSEAMDPWLATPEPEPTGQTVEEQAQVLGADLDPWASAPQPASEAELGDLSSPLTPHNAIDR